MRLVSVLVLACLAACGGGPSADDIQRSQREFDLAAAMEQEQNIPGSIQHLEKALDLDPGNARAELLLGYIHMNRQDLPNAEAHLRKGVKLMESQPDMVSALAEARNMLGVVLMQQKRMPEATALFKESAGDMLNRAPWYAWGNLGWAYYEQRKLKEAEEALLMAVRVQPRFCLGYYWLGRTYFDMQNFDKSEQALTGALESDERCKGVENQRSWLLRGEARARLGRREDAISDFERCVELTGKSDDGQKCQRMLDSTHD